ncbi:MAG: NUDIX hydrolase [Candidatus Kapaibacterium sp.]
MVAKWETVALEKLGNHKIFDLYHVTRRHPEWDKTGEFVFLDSPQWVNIIPITPDNDVVMIEQYRQGVDDITLEIPGGLVEEGENPRLAGQRECTEETGYYAPRDAILIGENLPNPAFLNNVCYHYAWQGCTLESAQALDSHEDINVRLIPLADIPQMIAEGRIRHSLVLTAFFFYSLKIGF